MKIKFTVPGNPFGKERPNFARMGQKVVTYTPQKTVNYETLVKWAYQQSAHGARFANRAMLDARIFMYFEIPQSTSKKERELMLKGVVRPIKKPDVDNAAKAILDALNKLAYRDDAQIVDHMVRKFYSENPRVDVIISDICPEELGE